MEEAPSAIPSAAAWITSPRVVDEGLEPGPWAGVSGGLLRERKESSAIW